MKHVCCQNSTNGEQFDYLSNPFSLRRLCMFHGYFKLVGNIPMQNVAQGKGKTLFYLQGPKLSLQLRKLD